MKRDILTPAIVIFGVVVVILALWVVIAEGQTHTMPGANVVPSGATLTIQSGGTINAAAGSTVTGFGAGGAPGGSTTQLQYNNSGAFGGVGVATYSGGTLSLRSGAATVFYDGTDPTKQLGFNLVNILTGNTVSLLIPNAAAPVAVAPDAGATNNYLTGITSLGVVTKARPAIANLSDAGTLATWAAITPTANVGTWLATPSSANLRGALTDENGTGAALFSGATTPDFTTGFTIGAAAASGKIPIGNGTNYVPSTPTFSNAPSTALKWMRSDGTNWITSTSLLSDTPGTALKWLRSDGTNWITSTSLMSDTPGTAGKMLISDGTNWITSTATYPNTAGTAGYTLRSDGTNLASYPQDMFNSSVTSQATFSTSDIYITNSNVTVAAGDMKAKGQYRCLFDMTKSAGTGAIVISVRVGTLGAVGDAQILTFTFGAGTSIADTGTFEIIATWRTVGSGTSAVMQGVCRAQKNAATTTGLWNNTGTDLVIVAATSSGFASNTATNIGVSFNGSTAFAGTSTLCQSTLIQ